MICYEMTNFITNFKIGKTLIYFNTINIVDVRKKMLRSVVRTRAVMMEEGMLNGMNGIKGFSYRLEIHVEINCVEIICI